MGAEFDYLSRLAAKLPKGLYSDWQDTSHFELHSYSEYPWLGCGMGAYYDCDSEEGKRLGLIMDIAAEVGRLRDGGHLVPAMKETE